MRRHAFGFGSAVTAEMLLGDSPDAKQYQQHVRDLFSRVVLENDLKWQGWKGNRQRGLDAVAWLRREGIEVRGHNLVWPGWQYLPKDVVALKDQPDALRKAIADHVTDEATALRGQLVEWDVINEPWNNHDVADVLGKDVLVDWFKLAKAADPTARLFLNDFPTLTSPAAGDAHLAGFEQILRTLIDQKAPLEGIGFQCHYKGDFTPPEQILKGLDHFATLGKPIAITEFDYDTVDEDLQADATRDLLTAAFSHPAVNEVIMWGFWESRHWRPGAALYRKDWTQKPNGKAWEDLVKKQWWTNADGKTGKDGRYGVRGFLGEYEITARLEGKSGVAKGSLKKEGGTIAVSLK
jgi:GH35 family endo-1,4-beta-xylanase